MSWRCVACGRERASFSLRPTSDNRYRFGYCVDCRTDRHFSAVGEEPTARTSDPDTSHAAARDARVRAGTHRAKALEALRAAGARGLTDFELAALTGIAQTSIGVRRKELLRAGYVEATELRRPAPSGSAAIVWRAL